LIPGHGLLLAESVGEAKRYERKVPGFALRGQSQGKTMTDEKLHSLTENQLRALYNSAPEYLKTLLDRKRALEDGIVWEVSIPQRATRKAAH
jgi:hypothetical protein